MNSKLCLEGSSGQMYPIYYTNLIEKWKLICILRPSN